MGVSSFKLRLGIVAFVALVWFWGHGSRERRSLLAATPRRGDLAQVIREEGRTRYRTVIQVTMPFDGRLEPHQIEEATAVTRGEVLATVQENLPAAAVQVLESEIQALESELALRADVRDEEAAVARARAGQAAAEAAVDTRTHELAVRRTALAWAELERNRIRELKARGAAMKSEADRVESEYESAKGTAAAAEAQLGLARAEVDAARADLALALAALDSQKRLQDQLRSRIESQRARLVPLVDDRQRFEIRSPLAGEVLQVFQRSPAFLPRGAPLFEIGDPTTLEVEVDLLSEDALRVRAGGPFGIYGKGLGERELPVDLRQVSPHAFTKRSSLGVEEQRAHAWFTFRGRPEGLGNGYRVHLRAGLEVARDALLAPRRALLRIGNGWAVYKAVDGAAVLAPVEIGLGDESWVVIRKGLGASDQLLLDVPETLEEGDPVTPKPAVDLPDPARLPGLG